MNLTNYLMAGFQILFIETFEIKRCINSIEIDQFINDELTRKVIWNILTGTKEGDHKNDSLGMLNAIESMAELSVIILENFDVLLDDDPIIQQKLLNLSEEIKEERKMIIIVGSNFDKIPKILEKVITKLEFELPKEEDFKMLIESLSNQPEIIAAGITPDYSVASACKGLSFIEAENILSKSLVENEKFDKNAILEMKRIMIKKTGFMDIIEPESLENLAGLDNLKEILFARKEAWEPDSIKPKLKSVFLVGQSGCGKSLTAKVMASIFECPLIIVDIGSLKGSLVGQTEKNVRTVTMTIDAFGMCIVFMDEIDKSLGGAAQALDSGTSLGIVGHLLTWTQESKGEKIIVATANDISNLPAEFIRRFEDVFFVDFPNFSERKEIVNIMNRRYQSSLSTDDSFIRRLENWTGAEIESLAKKIHFFDLEKSMSTIPLIYKVNPEAVERMKKFSRGVEIANKKEEITKEPQRKVTIERKDDLEELKVKLKKKLLFKKIEKENR